MRFKESVVLFTDTMFGKTCSVILVSPIRIDMADGEVEKLRIDVMSWVVFDTTGFI